MKKISQLFFKYRSYTPIPFLILMVIFQEATLSSLIAGFVVVCVGEFFRLWGVSYAGSETRTTGGGVGGTYLVVTGAFSHVRNPLYFGNMTIYVGIGLMSLAWYPYLMLIAAVFFFIQYTFIIREEENYLHEKFGELYEEYKAAVPRWIPTLTKFKHVSSEQPTYDIKKGLRSERRTLQAISITTLLLVILYLVA
jgi:protein-S-isoprenylcysteine O-methyltransferase Ste14